MEVSSGFGDHLYRIVAVYEQVRNQVSEVFLCGVFGPE